MPQTDIKIFNMKNISITDYLKIINDIKDACYLLNKSKNINIRYNYDKEVKIGEIYFIEVYLISYFSDGTNVHWTTLFDETRIMQEYDQADSQIGIRKNLPLDKKRLLRIAYTIFSDYKNNGRKQ